MIKNSKFTKNLEYEHEIYKNLENFESVFEFFVNFESIFEFFVISSFLSMVDEVIICPYILESLAEMVLAFKILAIKSTS